MKPGRILFVLMAAFALVAALLGGYTAAYVQLGEYADYRGYQRVKPTNQIVRHYRGKEWCLTVFAPAAAFESWLIGVPVHLTYSQPDYPHF